MSRDKLPAILIDSDFFDKPRNIAFVNKCGIRAIVAVQAIWCVLSKEREWFLDESMMIPQITVGKILANDPFSPQDWTEFLLNCIEFGLQETKIVKGKKVYFNSRVVEHGESFLEKRKGYKDGWEKRKKMDPSWIHNKTIPECENGSSMVLISTHTQSRSMDLGSEEGSGEKPEPETPIPETEILETRGSVAEVLSLANRLADQKSLKKALEKPKEPEETLDEYTKAARQWLANPEEYPQILRDNRFVMAGRKPFKACLDIWISEPNLADVLRQYEEAGIPRKRFKDAMKALKSKLETYRIQSRPVEKVDAYAWLTSFIKNDLLVTLNNEKKLQLTEARSR